MMMMMRRSTKVLKNIRYLNSHSLQPIVPKKLNDIVKMDLIADQTEEELTTIWNEYHSQNATCVSSVIHSDQWNALERNTKECPLFAFPVKRDAGAYFVLFSEWKGNHCAMTYLADYQKDPNTALHYLYLVAYTEFLKDKNIVLLRGEFQPYLTKTDADHLLQDSLKYYSVDDESYSHVKTFNLQSHLFDFNKVFKL